LYLVRLSANDPALDAQADALYNALQVAGISVMYDDRDATAGVKFADADLIGIPVRATLSARSLKNGGVARTRSDQSETPTAPLEQTPDAARALLALLWSEADARVIAPPYPENEPQVNS